MEHKFFKRKSFAEEILMSSSEFCNVVRWNYFLFIMFENKLLDLRPEGIVHYIFISKQSKHEGME